MILSAARIAKGWEVGEFRENMGRLCVHRQIREKVKFFPEGVERNEGVG